MKTHIVAMQYSFSQSKYTRHYYAAYRIRELYVALSLSRSRGDGRVVSYSRYKNYHKWKSK